MTDKNAIVMDAMRRALSRVGRSPDYGTLVAIAIQIIEEEKSLKFAQSGDGHSIHMGLKSNDPELGQCFRACYMRMITDGIVVPNPEVPNFQHLTFFDVSDFGKKWSAEKKCLPENRGTYLASLRLIVPHLDPVVEQYIGEALITYERRALFASAVMVGAASEKLLYMLSEAVSKSLSGQAQKEINNAVDERSIVKLLERIQQVISSAQKKMPHEIYEGSNTHLLSLMEAIRVQRNDAVHPVTANVSISGVWMSLIAFPAICRKIYDLIEWLSTNKL